jgi:hypothetical protein
VTAHGNAQLVHRALLKLAHALLADAERLAQILKRYGFVTEVTFLDDRALAVRQTVQRSFQPRRTRLGIFHANDDFLRVRISVFKKILPLAVAVFADRCIK